MIFLLLAGTGYSDTVLLRNGDELIGEIQNEYFVVRGSYSQIVVNKAFCKGITMDPDQMFKGSLQTMNNDFFTGIILNREIQILLTDETREIVNINDLNSLFFDISGPSRQVLTTIFTMENGDRFSGKLVNPEVEIQTESMTVKYGAAEINRIDFVSDAPNTVKMLLINREIILGKLLLDEIKIEPDSVAQLAADRAKFRSIQFNARKMLLKKYSNTTSHKDGDRDGVPDDADTCRNTPWGNQVDENGCSRGKVVLKLVTKPEITSAPLADKSRDGVPDFFDKRPQTPLVAGVDGGGSWITQDILFDFDSYLVKRSYYPVLDNIFAVLKKNPMLKIKIQGSADNIGAAEYNQILSEKRAQAVKKYLVEKGIEPERLKTVGYGSTRKAASNKTAAGRALNRRTDFLVME